MYISLVIACLSGQWAQSVSCAPWPPVYLLWENLFHFFSAEFYLFTVELYMLWESLHFCSFFALSFNFRNGVLKSVSIQLDLFLGGGGVLRKEGHTKFTPVFLSLKFYGFSTPVRSLVHFDDIFMCSEVGASLHSVTCGYLLVLWLKI